MNGFGNVNQLSSVAREFQTQNKSKVSVKGWQNATQQDLLNFVMRKTKVAIQDAYMQGESIVGYVGKHEVAGLLKFNGIRFAGNSLKFESLDGPGPSSVTSNTITLLRNFLMKRYNGPNKMLDLGNLYQDQELVQNGLLSSISTQSKMFLALMKLASTEARLEVESVNLSNNNLKDVNGVSALAQTFPGLKNLCLANNQIARLQSLDVWKNKFRQLRELLMMNNPVANDPSYKAELLRIFPKLVILDNMVVRDEAKLNSIYTFPMPQQQFFFEDNSLGSSAIEFVTNFLGLWDTNRSQLMGLYSPQSQFSVSVDSSVPPTTVPGADQSASFGYYLPSSRNLTKVSSEKSKQERLGIGAEAICGIFKTLPGTKHYLQEQPDNYSLQTWSYFQVGGFVVTLHGVFEETSKPEMESSKSTSSSGHRHRRYHNSHQGSSQNRLSKKSFDRTWVIVPSQGGLIVASEMLTVRPYALGAWTTSPKQTQAPAPAVQPPVQPEAAPIAPNSVPPYVTPQSTLQLPPEIQAKMTAAQMELLNRLHLETKLNAEYTYMLAEQSGWNYESAIKGFQGSVNNLPRNAFV